MMWSSPRQENGGPMGRSVYDCAAVLDVIAGYDAADLATEASVGRMPERPYVSYIRKDGLAGARLGVLLDMVRTGPGHEEGGALFRKAVAAAKSAGATLVDVRSGIDLVSAQGDAGASNYEVAVAIDKYLAALPPDAPVRTVAEMIEKGGSIVKSNIVEAAKSHTPLERNVRLIAAYRQQDAIRELLVRLMDTWHLDALILPFRTYEVDAVGLSSAHTQTPEARNNLSSYTGLPTIVVPGGFFPADGMPFGVQFLGRPFTEPVLIRVASGFEAVTGHRKAPSSTPPLAGETIAY
jgi:Asp-tRNA(Asn)/Glu-tRNA(Gln) amidotransferase A subunit family amidase